MYPRVEGDQTQREILIGRSVKMYLSFMLGAISGNFYETFAVAAALLLIPRRAITA
jgi:uncharacterized membrane protein YoaK (UPF0700 family)